MNLCGLCLAKPPPQQRTLAPWLYRVPVDTLITRYKFRGDRAAGRLLAEEWLNEVDILDDDRPEALVPCPLHRRRLHRRGFNQASELAQWLGESLSVPVRYDLCRRLRPGPAQTSLNRAQRLANLKSTFSSRAGVPGHVAIVDDVVTTGATSAALARVLLQSGARRVDVWALARTP